MGEKQISKEKAKEIWDEAQTFEKSCNTIHRAAHEYAINKNDENSAIGLTYAAYVNHAYAFELYLKCLLVIENGSYWTGHELLKLFEKLPPATQDEITTRHDTLVRHKPIIATMWEQGDFKKSLTEASKAFMDYRYLFEGKPINDEYELNFPMGFVKDAIIKRCPEFIKK